MLHLYWLLSVFIPCTIICCSRKSITQFTRNIISWIELYFPLLPIFHRNYWAKTNKKGSLARAVIFNDTEFRGFSADLIISFVLPLPRRYIFQMHCIALLKHTHVSHTSGYSRLQAPQLWSQNTHWHWSGIHCRLAFLTTKYTKI